jgi:hypothetical protein
MDLAWPEAVRSSGKLLIWAASGGGGWAVALHRAIIEFNRVTHTRNLKLRIERARDKKLAQVIFRLGNESDFANPLHGVTDQYMEVGAASFSPATISVHPNPQVRAWQQVPGKRDRQETTRPAGEGVRMVIIAHEVIHACGLDENHSTEGAGDVFYSPLEPDTGSHPRDDGMKAPISNGARFPPVTLSGETVRRLRQIWG